MIPTTIPIKNKNISGVLFFDNNTAIIAIAGAIPTITFFGITIESLLELFFTIMIKLAGI